MKAPYEKNVIQIDITNVCDIGDCSNCTRMLAHHKKKFFMGWDNFRRAVESLVEYPGVIGLFGGNPCLHPDFERFAEWFAVAIPEKRRRGLWSNHLRGHDALVSQVFGYMNLNVHGSTEAADAIRAAQIKAPIWGERKPSIHSPTLTAIRDMVGTPEVPDEAAMWAKIEKCDINLYWSGCITELPHAGRGLRAYFCEVAAAFDHLYQEDHGVAVDPGWWRRPISDYQHQVNRWCPACGVPLKLAGHVDTAKTDDVSAMHLPVIKANRAVVVHDSASGPRVAHPTDYQEIRR